MMIRGALVALAALALLAPGTARATLPPPAALAASVDSCWGVRLDWGALAGADSFYVGRGAELFVTVDTLFRDTAAPAGSTGYWVAGIDATGTGDTATVVGFRPSAPVAPSVIAAGDDSCGVIRIDWDAAAEADSYRVFQNGAPLAVTAEIFYRDTLSSPGAYEYTVSAFNACGESAESQPDSGSRPPDGPGPPANPAASDTSCVVILVTWEDVAGEEGYRVYRDGGLAAELSADAVAWEDPGVGAGELHGYRVESFNGCGVAMSDSVTGERLAPPAAPPSIVASDTSCSHVYLEWGVSAEADSYRVYRDLSLVATLPAAALSLRDTLSAGSYGYSVDAGNRCGWVSSATDSGAVLPSAAPPPSLTASDTSCSHVYLEWGVSAEADSYAVFRGGTEIALVLAPALAWIDSNAAGSYGYEVFAANGCGRSVAAADSGSTVPAPARPVSLAATDTVCGAIEISWEAVADADGYRVVRDDLPLAETDTAFYADSAAAPESIHTYAVVAFNGCGESPESDPVNGSRPPAAPPAPLSVTATDTVCGAIEISWEAAPGASGYLLLRDDDSLALTDTIFHADSTALADTFYTYKIIAFNDCGGSPESDPAVGSRPFDGPAVPAGLAASDTVCAAVEMSWVAVAEADSYRVTRDTAPFAVTDTSFYADTTALPGASHLYQVAAFNGCGESAASDTVRGSVPPGPPPPPDPLAATSDRCDGVLLSWSDVSGEEGYLVFRDSTLLDTLFAVDGVAFLDTTAPAGSLLSYMVAGYNRCTADPLFSTPAAGLRVPAPAAPVLLAADSVCGGIRLTWVDGVWEEGYVVVRNGIPIDTLAANDTSLVDSTVSPGWPDSAAVYTVGAFNTCSPGPVFGLSVTGFRPYDAPAPPSNVTATDDSCGVVRVAWSASDHADGYRIYREGSQVGSTGSTFYRDGSSGAGTFVYTVTAFNECGESVESGPDAGSRPPDAPPPPSNPAASNTSCMFILVTWSDIDGEEGYRVYRDGDLEADLAANTVEYRDAFVGSGEQHSYQIESYNRCGGAFSIAIVGERIFGFPPSPEQVSATDDECDAVTVTWSFTGNAAELDSFSVSFREAGSAVVWTRAGSAAAGASQFVHTPSPGVWEYLVQAHDSCGASPESEGSRDEGERLGLPGTPVFLPGGSDTEVCGGMLFRLTWSGVEGADTYVLEEEGGETWTLADTTRTLTREGAGTWNYTVRAEGPCGTSGESVPWPVQIQAVPVPPSDVTVSDDLCGAIEIRWTPAAASNVWIERDGARIYLEEISSWVDSIADGGGHSYSIGGWNRCDTLDAEVTLTGFAWPPALAVPVAVTASDGLCDSVRITWDYFPEQIGVDSFRVLRFDGPLFSTVAVVAAGETYAAVDTSVSPSRRYAYKVRAENPCVSAISDADTGFAYTGPERPVWDDPAPASCVDSLFTLSWEAVAGADSYHVFLGGSPVRSSAGTELTLTLSETGARIFTVAAANDCGDGPSSETWTVTVSESPAPPAAVSLDTAWCDSLLITWSAQEDSIRVYRDDEPVWEGPGDGRLVDSPAASVTYHVHSFNGCGESNGVGIFLASPRLRPPAPSSVTATDAFCDSVVLTWSFPQSEVGFDRIDVVRSRNDTTIVIAGSLPPSARRHVDISGEGTYSYEIVARNDCGPSTGDETSRDDGGFLASTPTALFLERSDTLGCAGGIFALRWEPVTGALYYRLWEGSGGDENVIAVIEAGRDTIAIDAEGPGERTFRIQAVGVCGVGDWSEPWITTVIAAPESPAGLAATTDRCGEVVLAWTPPPASVTGVRIWRDGSPAAYVATPGTTWTDTDITGGVEYVYTAAGENGCGLSTAAGPVTGSARPGLAAPALAEPPDGAEELPIPVDLSWLPVEGGAIGYLLRVEPAGGGEAVADTLLAATGFALSDLDLGAAYRWRVATRNECGTGAPSVWRTFATFGLAPSALASNPAFGAAGVDVDIVIRVTFSVPVDETTLDGATLYRGSEEIAGARSLDGGGSVLLFDPDEALAYGEMYQLDFSGLADVFGRSFEEMLPLTFTTKPGERPYGDLDDDFERDLSDVALAVAFLLGEEDPGIRPIGLIDLNGDGRFTVADLVRLARVLVSEGTVLLPDGGADDGGEPLAMTARIEPGDRADRYEIDLAFPLPAEGSAGFVEIDLARPTGAVVRVDVRAEDGEAPAIWYGRSGEKFRVLLAASGERSLGRSLGPEVRLLLQVEGGEAPERVDVSKVEWSDGDGKVRRFRPAGGGPVRLQDSGALLVRQNRPNPFNPATTIDFYLPSASFVRLRLFDAAGRAVALLVEGNEPAGWRAAAWNGRTESGLAAASGVYFARLETPDGTRTIRMILIR